MLKIIHIELSEANELVSKLHRHHKKVVGHRFSIGVYDNKVQKIVGQTPKEKNAWRRNTWQI